MDKFQGGFLSTTTKLIRTGAKSHTNALDRPISQAHIDALNDAQRTGWRTNEFISDVMSEAWVDKHPIAGLQDQIRMVVPGRLTESEWALSTPEEQAIHRTAQAVARKHNASVEGKETAFLDCLDVAERVRGRPIWFPYSLDFRGRIYPVSSSGLTPQGADVAKALLMFDEGKPLGPDGEYWLRVRAAGYAGMDKATLADRVKWTFANQDDIVMSAADPLGHTWWASVNTSPGDTMKNPWCFLATCYELAIMLDTDDHTSFVSHLPIPLDGTCSGIQHLSAMGLDPVGAHATNLTSTGVRQDIYQEVANAVNAAISEDHTPEADMWRGKVNRGTAKRSVMTTPYGVSNGGIARQLLTDGHCNGVEVSQRRDAAAYLRDRLVEALQVTVVAAKEIMAWLQEVARALAAAQVPMVWTTPVGTVIRQAYYDTPASRIDTLAGRMTFNEEHVGGGLQESKSASAMAPNVIHSFDAAHCALTVNKGASEGISSWALIHDSFGTHACQTTKLNGILRDEFIRMYRHDWLAAIAAEIGVYAPHVVLPALPVRGSFDLDEVRKSEFFFS